jgi:hypothetical protein
MLAKKVGQGTAWALRRVSGLRWLSSWGRTPSKWSGLAAGSRTPQRSWYIYCIDLTVFPTPASRPCLQLRIPLKSILGTCASQQSRSTPSHVNQSAKTPCGPHYPPQHIVPPTLRPFRSRPRTHLVSNNIINIRLRCLSSKTIRQATHYLNLYHPQKHSEAGSPSWIGRMHGWSCSMYSQKTPHRTFIQHYTHTISKVYISNSR